MENILDKHVSAYQGDNIYDFDNDILLNWYPQRILELSSNATSILELGLGHGFTSNIFSRHFERHVVLEGSSAVIENYRVKNPNSPACIIETYFETFETREKFDVIVMGFILEHVDNPLQIMARFKKFLASHGKMFVAVPNAEVLNRRIGHHAGLLPDIQQLSDNDLLLGHKRYYTLETFINEIKQAGYEIEVVEGIYLKPFTTQQITSLRLDKNIIHALCEVGINYPELCCGMMAEIREPQ